jgi:hypothetical protein
MSPEKSLVIEYRILQGEMKGLALEDEALMVQEPMESRVRKEPFLPSGHIL